MLDYPLTPYLWDGVRRAFRTMAELQFAAGAIQVMPIHGAGTAFASYSAARAGIDAFALAPLMTPVVSAHVMGGCPMGSDERRTAVDSTGRLRHLANVHVVDGSLFPTSIGANPQLSIYAIAARLADGIAATLKTGRAGEHVLISVTALTTSWSMGHPRRTTRSRRAHFLNQETLHGPFEQFPRRLHR